MGIAEIDDLFEAKGGLILEKEMIRHMNRKNAPVLDAMAKELVALMHKYGLYFYIHGHVFETEDFPKGLEVGVSGSRVHMDSDGDLTKDRGKEGFGIFPINPPNAHQKLAQATLRRRLVEEAKAKE